jgi:hypothetical protein
MLVFRRFAVLAFAAVLPALMALFRLSSAVLGAGLAAQPANLNHNFSECSRSSRDIATGRVVTRLILPDIVYAAP